MDSKIPLESSIVSSCIRWLNKQLYCKAQKTHGSMLRMGTPDILGCWQERALVIEVKRPGNNRVTELQRRELDAWAAAGAITGVVHSLEELKILIEEATGTELPGRNKRNRGPVGQPIH